MDNDLLVLEQAAAAVLSIDRKYRRADFKGKRDLKKGRDGAFNAYAKARLELLKEGMICTGRDVETMKQIRSEIGRARQIQSTFVGALKLAKFLAKLAR